MGELQQTQPVLASQAADVSPALRDLLSLLLLQPLLLPPATAREMSLEDGPGTGEVVAGAGVVVLVGIELREGGGLRHKKLYALLISSFFAEGQSLGTIQRAQH